MYDALYYGLGITASLLLEFTDTLAVLKSHFYALFFKDMITLAPKQPIFQTCPCWTHKRPTLI